MASFWRFQSTVTFLQAGRHRRRAGGWDTGHILEIRGGVRREGEEGGTRAGRGKRRCDNGQVKAEAEKGCTRSVVPTHPHLPSDPTSEQHIPCTVSVVQSSSKSPTFKHRRLGETFGLNPKDQHNSCNSYSRVCLMTQLSSTAVFKGNTDISSCT